MRFHKTKIYTFAEETNIKERGKPTVFHYFGSDYKESRMNINSQSVLLQNAQWPFTYPYKSYDFAIHPAFLQTACRVLPSTQYGVASEQSQTSTPKVDKFSIDAILKKDKDNDRAVKDKCITNSYDSSTVVNDEMELACRRYQRLYEIGHPYLSTHHQAAGSDKAYLQKHLPAYKQFSERSRSGKPSLYIVSLLPERKSYGIICRVIYLLYYLYLQIFSNLHFGERTTD